MGFSGKARSGTSPRPHERGPGRGAAHPPSCDRGAGTAKVVLLDVELDEARVEIGERDGLARAQEERALEPRPAGAVASLDAAHPRLLVGLAEHEVDVEALDEVAHRGALRERPLVRPEIVRHSLKDEPRVLVEPERPAQELHRSDPALPSFDRVARDGVARAHVPQRVDDDAHPVGLQGLVLVPACAPRAPVQLQGPLVALESLRDQVLARRRVDEDRLHRIVRVEAVGALRAKHEPELAHDPPRGREWHRRGLRRQHARLDARLDREVEREGFRSLVREPDRKPRPVAVLGPHGAPCALRATDPGRAVHGRRGDAVGAREAPHRGRPPTMTRGSELGPDRFDDRGGELHSGGG